MTRRLALMFSGAVFVFACGAASAHHSFAMFDSDNPVEIEGIVEEYKFISPHSFILLQVKEKDGSTTTWNLEGLSPSALVREGWSSKSLKKGDQLKMQVNPLRSGAPGGAWFMRHTRYMDGQLVVQPPATSTR